MGILPLVLMGLENVISAVVFVMFIYEESIQTASMGCYLAIKYRDVQGLDGCILQLRDNALPGLKNCVEDWGWIAPYAWPCFEMFVRSTTMSLEVYENIRANWKY